MDKLAEIAKRLGVEPDALRGLYEEMVQADTGSTYADLVKQLTPDAETPVADTEAVQLAKLNADLAAKWNVTPEVVNARLARLNTVYESLPEGSRSQYESLDGISSLWDVVNTTSPQAPAEPTVRKADAPLTGISPASLLSSAPKTTQFDFDTLVNMPEEDYAKIANSGELLAAFNSGSVRDTRVALTPQAVQTSALTGHNIR